MMILLAYGPVIGQLMLKYQYNRDREGGISAAGSLRSTVNASQHAASQADGHTGYRGLV
jgi:hypothetical protein